MKNALTDLIDTLPLNAAQIRQLLKVSETKFFAYKRPVEENGTKLPDYIAAHCETLLALHAVAPGEIIKLYETAKAGQPAAGEKKKKKFENKA